MSLLVLDRVTKRFGERAALVHVSFVMEPGELVGVWGRRRSGRSTLLAVAAGIEPPTSGEVRFDGADLAARPLLGERDGVSCCTTDFPAAVGGTAVEQVAMPLLGRRRANPAVARRRAEHVLSRVGAAALAAVPVADLGHADATRVGLARALVSEPRLVVIDQPTAGVSIAAERDPLLALLRSIADDGVAVLMAVDEGAELAGADRALTIDAGELRGETLGPQPTEVISLRRAASS